MRSLLTSILASAGLLATAFSVHAAEITLSINDTYQKEARKSGYIVDADWEIFIDGTIESGDHARLVHVAGHAVSQGKPFVVRIDSPGGDYPEAMKMGRFLQTMNVMLWVHGAEGFTDPTRCHGAAVLLVVGAPSRVFGIGIDEERELIIPNIALLRPYAREIYESKNESEWLKYNELSKAVRSYLEEMGAPETFIDRMFNASDPDSLDYVPSGVTVELVKSSYFDKRFRIPEYVSLETSILDYLPHEETSLEESNAVACPDDLTDQEYSDIKNKGGSEGYLNYLREKLVTQHKCLKAHTAQIQREAYRKMLEEQGVDFDRRMKELAAEFEKLQR